MSDPERLIEILTAIALVLIFIIMGLVLIYLYVKYKGNQKKVEKTKVKTEEEQKLNSTNYNINSIFNFMDFEKIEDNMIIQKRGKYLMVLECQGVNYDLMSEMERTAVEQGFIQFLNTLRSEIQIYVQTRTVNLEDSISSYKTRFRDIERKYEQMERKYNQMKKTEGYSEKEIQSAYLELVKQKNKYEYTKDIIANTERTSLNSSVLHKRYYIILPFYEDEIVTDNCSKEEIQNMVFSELYTKARSMIRTLSRCDVNSTILDSEGLIDLLYVAYNRDEADILGAKKALQAGYEDVYTTAPDVFERRLRLLNKQIEEEGMKLASEAIEEAKSESEMILRIRERNRQNLIYDFADTIIDENITYIGAEVSADAKAKVNAKRKQTAEGGNKDANEKKTRGRKTTN